MSDHEKTPGHPYNSSSSSSSSIPSFVGRIDLEAIVSLATSVRQRTSSAPTLCTVTPEAKIGGFNVVWFIDFSDGLQWVLRTPISDWSPHLQKRLELDIAGMRFLQNRTSLPIPRIHEFSVDPENLLGRPYIIMDRVKGTQLSKLWFDPVWFTVERRRTVFQSLASLMTQLKEFEFSAIGTLDYDVVTDSYVIGPLVPSAEDISNGDTTTRGPYNSVYTYLLDGITHQLASDPTIDHKASLLLLRILAGCLPDETLDGPPFVLSMTDFNYQNIFVDEDGNVTGLIDWDDLSVGPRQSGYARYPSWITRDWDPLMYAYPDDVGGASSEEEGTAHVDEGDDVKPEKKTPPTKVIPPREVLREDSPSTLQAFREEYVAAIAMASPGSEYLTRDSHILEALEIAIYSPFCRGHILDKLARHMFGQDKEFGRMVSSWSLEQAIKEGDWVKQFR